MFYALFVPSSVSSLCTSQVQTDMNASKPQRWHNGYTHFTKTDHQVPSRVSSTYDALAFVFNSQSTGAVVTSLPPSPNARFKPFQYSLAISKAAPSSEVKYLNLPIFTAILRWAHSCTHRSFAITLLHTGILLLHHPLHFVACVKWEHYLSLPFCALHFLLSTHLTSTMILLFISCWTINVVFLLELFFIHFFFLFPLLACSTASQPFIFVS